MTKRNKYKKLSQLGTEHPNTLQSYEEQLGRFYLSKYQRVNWAQ
jgi:hypothetical protein